MVTVRREAGDHDAGDHVDDRSRDE